MLGWGSPESNNIRVDEEHGLSELAAVEPLSEQDLSRGRDNASTVEANSIRPASPQRQRHWPWRNHASPSNSDYPGSGERTEDEPNEAAQKSVEEESIGAEKEESSSTLDEESDAGAAQNLTELTAPRPDQDDNEEIETVSGRWRRHHSLEEEQRSRRSLRLSMSRTRSPGEQSLQGLGPPSSRSTIFWTQVFIVCNLIFYSIWGTLARLGVQWITFYPGAPVIVSDLWANFGGSLLMGFLVEDRKLFREEWGSTHKSQEDGTDPDRIHAAHKKAKKTIPLFLGLTVGFCGSFTSFSTFIRDVFLALANSLATPHNHPNDDAVLSTTVQRNKGYDFEAPMAVVILTVSVSIGGLMFGSQLASALEKVTPTIPFRLSRRVLDPLFTLLGIGMWSGAIVLACLAPENAWRGEVVFALVFAPVGCLSRFYLSVYMNNIFVSFPLGTFTANIGGVVVFAILYTVQHDNSLTSRSSASSLAKQILSCQVLQGLEDGFCGCLTTVSTWVLELSTLRKSHAYRYGIASLLIALTMDILIMGSVMWTSGFSDQVCDVETS